MAEENIPPYLYSLKPLNDVLRVCKKIPITTKSITIGRHVNNDFVLPDNTLSRKICKISMDDNNKWYIEVFTTFGIQINNVLYKANKTLIELKNNDILQFDVHGNYIYKFFNPKLEDVVRKRKGKINKLIGTLFSTNKKPRMSQMSNDTQQTVEIIKDAYNIKLRNRLKKMELKYEEEIKALKGEKDQVLKEKVAIENTRMLELKSIQREMEEKIRRHQEKDQMLLKENEEIKKIYNIMQATILAQEVIVAEDKKEIELLKEKEAKMQRAEEIDRDILEKKRNLLTLAAQFEEAEKEYRQLSGDLSTSKQLIEKAEKEKTAAEMEAAAAKAAAAEAAAAAAEAAAAQAAAAEAAAAQAAAAEAAAAQAAAAEAAAAQAATAQVAAAQAPKPAFNIDELIESELHCSICSELFIKASTLNCSHTFCLYCITVWKKKAGICPICRAPITSQCTSLVMDTFIDKLVENYPNDLKESRNILINQRMEPPKTPNVSKSSKRKRRR